jgi:hypothetical protein
VRILPFALLSFFLACNEPQVRDVLAEFHGSRYSKSLETREHKIEVRWVPQTLQLLNSVDPSTATKLTRTLLDSLKNKGGTRAGLLFLMRLAPRDSVRGANFKNDVIYGNLSGYANYQDALNAYQFGFREKIWLEVDGERVPLSNYQMENTFGMTASRTFALLFPELNRNARRFEVKLVLDDIVPGLARKKIDWILPVGKYDYAN